MISTQTGTPEVDKPADKAQVKPRAKTKAKAKKKVASKSAQRKAEPAERNPDTVMTGRKDENKNVRASVGEETDPNRMAQKDHQRALLGKQRKIDWDHYRALSQYDGFALFGCLDDEVDSWIQHGAEPVRKAAKSRKIFKGLNDNTGSEWEYVVVGKDDGGNPIKCFLLFISDEEYYRLKIKPQDDRNHAIQESMGMGVINNEGTIMGNVKGLKTYAPYTTVNGEKVGNGAKGLNTEVTHDV